ncbi:MAG TPA: four helix bundle protein, partial [Polyangiaceae bacterium]|nr:four helix bundle protein [Polyangiaceae bacterium]
MALHVATVSLELIQLLRPLLQCIRKRDRSLADQLSRAASSIALNVADADRSQGGNVLARFHSAAGSANETRMALRIAVAWGYLSEEEAADADRHLDRVIAMLWKL